MDVEDCCMENDFSGSAHQKQKTDSLFCHWNKFAFCAIRIFSFGRIVSVLHFNQRKANQMCAWCWGIPKETNCGHWCNTRGHLPMHTGVNPTPEAPLNLLQIKWGKICWAPPMIARRGNWEKTGWCHIIPEESTKFFCTSKFLSVQVRHSCHDTCGDLGQSSKKGVF